MIKPKKPSKKDVVKVAKLNVRIWGAITVTCALGMLYVLVASVGFVGVLLPIIFQVSFVQWCKWRDNEDRESRLQSIAQTLRTAGTKK